MTTDVVPESMVATVGAYRRRLDAYLAEVTVPYRSVAGEIIVRELARAPRDGGRACLAMWACEAVGGDPGDALPLAAAVELFARSAALRDGLPERSSDEGIGQQLNAGDALNALAYRQLALGDGPLEARLRAGRIVTAALVEAGGRSEAALAWIGVEAGALLGGASSTQARRLRELAEYLGQRSMRV